MDIEIVQPVEIQIELEAPYGIGATQAGLAAGPPGTTPHIGANGNWFIGEEDTGVSAGGEPLFEIDGDNVAPAEDRKIEAQHLTGTLAGGLFHP